jgi:hypothetical protein
LENTQENQSVNPAMNQLRSLLSMQQKHWRLFGSRPKKNVSFPQATLRGKATIENKSIRGSILLNNQRDAASFNKID